MRQQYVDALNWYWPGLSNQERYELLWGATAYPAGDLDQIERQLCELADKSGGNLAKALAIADAEDEQAMGPDAPWRHEDDPPTNTGG